LDTQYITIDSACNTKCDTNTGNSYLCGCVSTTPNRQNDSNNINNFTPLLRSMMDDRDTVDFNIVYDIRSQSGERSSSSTSSSETTAIDRCLTQENLIRNMLNQPDNFITRYNNDFLGNIFQTKCKNDTPDTNIYINKLPCKSTETEPNKAKPYVAKCLSNNINEPNNVNTYMTLYKINKTMFRDNNEYIFKTIYTPPVSQSESVSQSGSVTPRNIG
jgi:hypothetical protein